MIRLAGLLNSTPKMDGKQDIKEAKKTAKNGGVAAVERVTRAASPTTVRIEFPCDAETIRHPSYSIQASTTGAVAGVDVRLDQGAWQSCRESLGLWWFDWRGFDDGEHEVVVRLRRPDGSTMSSVARAFHVELPA